MGGLRQNMIDKMPVKLATKPTSHYSIMIGANLFDLSVWPSLRVFSKIVIMTDTKVKKLYALPLCKKIKKTGHDCLLLSFPAGEKYKNNQTKQKIENTMLLHQCDRHTLIVALGGGVVGDLAGFIAAT